MGQRAGTAEEPCRRILVRRRALVAALTLSGLVAMAGTMAALLSVNGWHWLEAVIMAAFVLGLPWTMLGFWNSALGFAIARLARDPAGLVFPGLRAHGEEDPLTARTALAVCIRHEDAGRVLRRVEVMLDSLDATGWGAMFDVHVLSDSARPEVVAAEEAAMSALPRRHAGRVHYRRRDENTGFKAGNLREFLARSRGTYAFVAVLDADSLMSGPSLVRMVRVMQANPRLGILQSLVVGLPSGSAFARIFQFGMRHAMRAHTLGAAWWQGDGGPFWGHNALIRPEPFLEHCRFPDLPGRGPLGGQVLSHDQVEAAMMRRAGWEVRVLPEEIGSWEENPPSLPDFVKRDLRWCLGNMQYLRLLGRLDLHPMGRFQLVNAVFMYLGAPLWLLMLACGLAMLWVPVPPGAEPFPAALGAGLFAASIGIGMAPRLLGVLGVLLDRHERRRFGGGPRLLAGALLETVFSWLVGPVMMVAEAIFMAGLPFGAKVIWEAQNRRDRTLAPREAAAGLWPQTALGAAVAGLLAWKAPGTLPWAAPSLAAWLGCIPFACATSSPAVGALLADLRLCAIPEDLAPPPEITRLLEPSEETASEPPAQSAGNQPVPEPAPAS
ncbi:glucans biosynthesis glucosyltransferase MdoH [Arenibaculum pallidiluteum]|uniref:glucans biosynthesis glucosyltransferase MdoH n=1 Tax=Arenibaculum pallidiluteum TaxID=2812559 RepID=UPI001A96BB49|nr:glucans biosynthesis glucosyltransferase MdoH [Arenibaculum pallidiluteum]